MSARHPVIAVTGSSGAGTTTTSLAFRKIFAQLNLRAAEVDCFTPGKFGQEANTKSGQG